jgi:hypothetical protein
MKSVLSYNRAAKLEAKPEKGDGDGKAARDGDHGVLREILG